MTRTITNPNGAFGYGVTEDARYPATIGTFVVGAVAVTAGDVVVLEATHSATVGVAVIPNDASVATDVALTQTLGVAVDGGAVGDTINVVTHGYALVNVGTVAIVVGELATQSQATDGLAISTEAAETLVGGHYFGWFLSVDDTVGVTQAAVWVTGAC